MRNRYYVNASKAELLLFGHRSPDSLLSQMPMSLIIRIMNAPIIEQDAAFVDEATRESSTITNKKS